MNARWFLSSGSSLLVEKTNKQTKEKTKLVVNKRVKDQVALKSV